MSPDPYFPLLKWDAWNRLVEVKDGSTVVASYTYDGLNRRLTKTAGSETRHYYYDTQWRTLEERVGSTPDRQYTWGLRDRWDLIRRKRSTTNPLDETLYVLRDYLDPVAIADAAGNVVERYAYDAFGNVRFLDQNYGSRSNSSYGWDFLFHAEFRDPETKLYNCGHRYYDTGLGRWLSRDPIGEAGGGNLYSFLANWPNDTLDQFGLADVEDHHWFPRCGGDGQGLVNTVCGEDFLKIDDYTTSMSGPSTTEGTAHYYVTHTAQYTALWRKMYEDIVSRVPPKDRCCVLLAATRLVFYSFVIRLRELNYKGEQTREHYDPNQPGLIGPLFKSGVPMLHPWKKEEPNTDAAWMLRIAIACKDTNLSTWALDVRFVEEAFGVFFGAVLIKGLKDFQKLQLAKPRGVRPRPDDPFFRPSTKPAPTKPLYEPVNQ